MRTPFLIPALCLLIGRTSAQTVVDHSSYTFSTGVYPTFSVSFENTDAKTVETWWKDVLKDMSADLSNKKEVIATGARLPQVSSDTIAIFMKAVQPKKSTTVTAQIAFRVNNDFVGADSGERQITGCRDFIKSKAVAFKREVAQAQVDAATKKLDELRDQKAMLVKEKERAEGSVKKNQDKAEQAARDQETGAAELKEMEENLSAAQQEPPSEEGTARLNDLVKKKNKVKDKLDRNRNTERSAKAKVTELEQEISDNVRAQKEKDTQIEQQQRVVEDLRTRLAAID